jgi:hypothetical protein
MVEFNPVIPGAFSFVDEKRQIYYIFARLKYRKSKYERKHHINHDQARGRQER